MALVNQSIPLCILLSTLNGLFCVIANFSLSYPDYLAKQGKLPWPGYKNSMGYWINFTFQNLSEVGTIATWFGPVALTVPIGLGSMLLFNMLFYGLIVPIDHFSKSMRVGTYVIAIAVVLLPVDGPGAQDNQDIMMLLEKPLSLAWTAMMLVALFYTTVFLCVKSVKTLSSTAASVLLIVGQVSACVVANTTAKMFVIVKGYALITAIAIWFVCTVNLTINSMVAATAVDQSKFVPVATSVKLFINAVTGIIIWEDWRVVKSWAGYVSVFLLLFIGVYLMNEMDLFEHYDMVAETGADVLKPPEHYAPVETSDLEGGAQAPNKKNYGAISASSGAAAAKAGSNGVTTDAVHPRRVFFRDRPFDAMKDQ